MFDMSSEFRHQLAADRMAALRRSAEPGPPSSLRRAVGSGLVRLGLRLHSDGRVAALPTRPNATAAVTIALPAAGDHRTRLGKGAQQT